jgi:hypothetical protein
MNWRFDTSFDMDPGVPFHITREKKEMGEDAAV